MSKAYVWRRQDSVRCQTAPQHACSRAETERERRMPDCIRRTFALTAATILAALVAGGPPVCAQTLAAVKERGTLNCGVSQGILGFSSQEDENNWTGLDVDICRADRKS